MGEDFDPTSGWTAQYARPKIEPSAMHRSSAKEVVSLFVALVDEGLTEQQALVLVGTMLGTAGAAGTGNAGE